MFKKEAALTITKAANSNIVKNARQKRRKQYPDHKGFVTTINAKITENADHAINAGVFGQVGESASANPLLVAGSSGLFSSRKCWPIQCRCGPISYNKKEKCKT